MYIEVFERFLPTQFNAKPITAKMTQQGQAKRFNIMKLLINSGVFLSIIS